MKKNTFLYIIIFSIIISAANIYPMQKKERTICLHSVDLKKKEKYTKTICEHYFHTRCINEWIYGEKKVHVLIAGKTY